MSDSLVSRIKQAWKDRPRRRSMIVTDVTRMEGSRVCVGGYLESGGAIRPVVARTGLDEAWLQRAVDGPVAPFAVVELRVGYMPKGAQEPHTEDRLTPKHGQRVRRILTVPERVALLERTCLPALRDIFGAEIHGDATGTWGLNPPLLVPIYTAACQGRFPIAGRSKCHLGRSGEIFASPATG